MIKKNNDITKKLYEYHNKYPYTNSKHQNE